MNEESGRTDAAPDAAGLSHLRNAGFQCFHRKFASELKDVPLQNLMALGAHGQTGRRTGPKP